MNAVEDEPIFTALVGVDELEDDEFFIFLVVVVLDVLVDEESCSVLVIISVDVVDDELFVLLTIGDFDDDLMVVVAAC